MLETMSVLVIFFVLILVGFLFWTNVSKGQISNQIEEARQLRGIEVAQKALFLPEIQCSSDNVIKSDCIDILKLHMAADIINNNWIYYYDKFGDSRVFVKELYPRTGRNYTLYDAGYEDFSDKIITFMPVAIYDPRTDTNSYGIMEVNNYIK